jgi:hypothetical protein
MCCSHVQPLLLAGATSASSAVAPAPSAVRVGLEGVPMIPILIAVGWVNLVTIMVAACGVAARADAIEMEIIQRSRHEAGGHRRTSCGEGLSHGVRVVARGHHSTLWRIS